MSEKGREKPIAIALDTSILEQHAFSFEIGILKRLEQFSDADVVVLFPDVVISEAAKHLSEQLISSRNSLRKAINGTANAWGATKKARDEAYALLVTDADPEEIAKARIHDFINAVGGLIMECGAIDGIGDVIDRYFAGRPPFGAGSKKSEFPDALALAALSQWAEENGKLVVVSADSGWIEYCDERSELIGFNSLPDALEIFQEESAAYLGRRFLELLADGNLGLTNKIQSALSRQSDVIEVDVMIDSYFHVDDEILSVSVTLCDDAVASIDDVSVIEVSKDECVINFNVPVDISVDVGAYFLKWDSVDREYVPIGSATLKSVEEDQVSLLVSCSLRSSGDIKEITLIELEPGDHSIEFNDAEPDWMSEREQEE